MQLEKLEIIVAGDKDLKSLESFTDENRISKTPDYFISQYERQAQGDRLILLAQMEGVLYGYCVLNWQPKYTFFKAMSYPEIQDINVHKDNRRQGIASAMIAHCEGLALQRGGKHMGIAVGLTSSYGAAQRLYVKRGYIPDGHGVTCDRKAVASGEFRPVDDDLCLMMVKDLG